MAHFVTTSLELLIQFHGSCSTSGDSAPETALERPYKKFSEIAVNQRAAAPGRGLNDATGSHPASFTLAEWKENIFMAAASIINRCRVKSEYVSEGLNQVESRSGF